MLQKSSRIVGSVFLCLWLFTSGAFAQGKLEVFNDGSSAWPGEVTDEHHELKRVQKQFDSLKEDLLEARARGEALPITQSFLDDIPLIDVRLGRNGTTALLLSTQRADAAAVRLLLANGADPNLGSVKSPSSFPLSLVFQSGPDYFTARGIDFSDHRKHCDEWRNSVYEIVDLLLEHGAEINGPQNKITGEFSNPTIYSVIISPYDCVDITMTEYLIGKGMELETPRTIKNKTWTPLQAAIESYDFGFVKTPNTDMMNLLLDHGADPTLINKDGRNALHTILLSINHECRPYGSPDRHSPVIDIMKRFIAAGVNKDAKDKHGRTPLDVLNIMRDRTCTKNRVCYPGCLEEAKRLLRSVN
ncbi:ankyrin repeat domain-containing protein [Nisaea denitrificans]|uniref:ankyrin repeat domain-containing protein n=1 Tax=Nisaea denitrificans TaxID=390877 RepID=UPI0003FC58A5|nr:hypothetical protein [Nisaea denitrificans]